MVIMAEGAEEYMKKYLVRSVTAAAPDGLAHSSRHTDFANSAARSIRGARRGRGDQRKVVEITWRSMPERRRQQQNRCPDQTDADRARSTPDLQH